MTCPSEAKLSAYCDDALDDIARGKLDLHLRRCEACRAYVETEGRYGAALERAICPDPETLGLFIDDRLSAERLEGVAAHVLACELCREIVVWTREGQQRIQHGPVKQRHLRPRRRTQSDTAIWLGVAAAAAVLLVVVLFAARDVETPAERGVAEEPHFEDSETPREPSRETPDSLVPDPVRGGSEDDLRPPADMPRGNDPVPPVRNGDRAADRAGDRSGGDGQETGTDPAPSSTQSPKPRATPQRSVVVVALAGADLLWRTPDGVEAPLRGRVSLPAGSEIIGRREGGAFTTGGATCLLVGQARMRVAPGRVTLVRGEALVEAGAGAPEFGCGAAIVRVDDKGGRLLLDRDANSVVVCVISGRAKVTLGDASAVVEAGRAQRVRAGKLSPLVRGLAGRLERARALAKQADRASWVEVPRGVIAQRSLRAAAVALAAPDAKRRALACLAVESLLAADAHLASLPPREGDLVPRAERALEALLAEDPRSLVRVGAAPAVVLALINRSARTERRPKKATRATLEALGEALADLPLELLAQDAQAMLALRAIERAVKTRAFRGLWRGLSVRVRGSTLADLERALLCGKDSVERDRLLTELDASLTRGEAMSAEAIGRSQRVLVLARVLTPERAARILAKASDPALTALELAPLLSHAYARALGVSVGDVPVATIGGVKIPSGYRVTFTLRTRRRGRQAYLVGSWDGWLEEATPMTRVQGAWTTTLDLPAGHHEYKMRFSDGKWEIDAQNPVSVVDPQGNRNSAFDLD